MARDDLQADIRQRTARNPEFPSLVESALTRRQFGRWLADMRKRQAHLTQAAIAQQMRTSQANVSRLERGEDVRLSTIQRYAEALGCRVYIELREGPFDRSEDQRPSPATRLAA